MLKQKFALDYYSQICLQTIAVVSSIIVARVAGPTVIGIVAFGFSYAALFTFISDMNLGVAHIKLVSAGEDIGSCNSTYAILRALATIFCVFFSIATFFLLEGLKVLTLENKHQVYVVFICIFITALSSLIRIPLDTFIAKMQIAKKNAILLLQGLGTNVLKVTVVLCGFGALAISLSNLCVVVSVFVCAAYLFTKYPFSRIDVDMAKKYLAIAIPTLLGATIIPTIILYADTLMLRCLTDARQVGFYSVALKISSFVLLLVNSSGIIFFPLFSGYITKGHYGELEKKVIKFERFIHLFMVPLVIFFVLYASEIIKIILGSSYSLSVNTLSIAMIAALISVLAQPYKVISLAAGFYRDITVFHAINLLFLIGGIYVFASPRYLNLGSAGAAFGVLISRIFTFALFKLMLRKKLVQIQTASNLRYMFYGLCNFAIAYLVYRFFIAGKSIVPKIVFPIAYFSATYLSLYLLRLIGKRDFIILRDVLNMKSIGAYTTEEVFGKGSEFKD